MARSKQTTELSILELETGRVEFCILGLSPFLFNAMSAKAKGDLLLPRGTLSAADKASRLKHDPSAEFRSSVYEYTDNSRPTRLKFSSVAFKKAMATTALDIPGLKKAQIGRLIWAEGQDVDMYGIPQFKMDVVRMADIGRTPDIRTRAILPTWATRITINFVKPIINHKSLANLLAAAGRIVGVGDGRQEKGTHSYGQWEVVGENDPRYLSVMKTCGRVAQDKALKDPAYYDLESERLHLWFKSELERRGRDTEEKETPKRVPRAARNGSAEKVVNVQ